MTLPFSKYHALGNDFVVLDTASPSLPPHHVRALCDRNHGVGADGVLLFHAAPDPAHDARMIVLNADGSRPEMCGNGLRCIALRAAATLQDHPATRMVRIATDAGTRICSVALDPEHHQATVSVDMGPVELTGTHEVHLPDRVLTGYLARVGNPHLVVFDRLDDDTFTRVGRLASDPAFPDGINVSLVEPDPQTNHLRVRVWERGVGPTLACGTAACATAAVAAARQLVPARETITIHLPGGPLELAVDPATRRVAMTGPATRVFDGTFYALSA